MTKILFLTRDYPLSRSIVGLTGGVALWYQKQARAMSAMGHEIHVICQGKDGPEEFIDEAGVFVHAVSRSPKTFLLLYRLYARVSYDLLAWLELREVIRRFNIEVIDTPEWAGEGLLYCFKKAVPLVVSAHGSIVTQVNAGNYPKQTWLPILKFLGLLADFVLKKADKVIASSDQVHDELINRVHIDPSKIVTVYPFRIDPDIFHYVASDIMKNWGISDNMPTVLFVGRLNISKGIKVLCMAIPIVLKSIPDVRFIIVGRDTNCGPGGTSYKHYLQSSLNNDILEKMIFIDYVTETDLVKLYSACTIFVLPSLAESFPMPVFEALSCGKPVVATSTGIVPKLNLNYPFGLVVPPKDVVSLANAIIALVSANRSKNEDVSKNNCKIVDQFSFGKQVNLLERVYDSIIEIQHRKIAW